MKILSEFKSFALKGNVVDLAIAVIIGTAFGKIVSSLVSDIIMPLVNPLIPGGNWKSYEIGSGIKIGLFAGTILDFIVIAAVVFVLVKAMTITKKKAKEEAPPTPDKKEILLTEIRDLLKK